MISAFKKIINNCKNQKKSLIVSFTCSFVKSVLGITQILAIIYALDVILGQRELNNTLIIVGILTVACIVGNYVISYFEQINIMNASFFMASDKRIEVGNKLRKVPLGYFSSSSRSRIITTLTSSVSGIETASVMVFVNVITGLFSAFSFFIFMMVYDYRIGLIVGVGMLVYLLVVNYQMKLSKKNAPALQKAQNELSMNTLSFLEGIKVTKSCSYEKGDRKLQEAIQNSRKENIRLTDKSMPTQYLASVTTSIFESIILCVTLVLFLSVKDISLSKTIVLIIFSFMVYASLNQAGSMLSMIGLLDTALDEVDEIEKTKELENNKKELPSSNEIELKNVSFSYGDNEVLHDVSFKVKEKSFTAIVGPSGSGKTTICELIPRFLDVENGEILLGNKNIKDIDYEEVCRRISMVFQRVYLFEDTILNNVKFGKPDATLEEVKEACKKARCHDFIMKLENGYDTVLKEGGASLSGGERQRLSIARAILKDSPIIILDEATASVDPENEYEIIKAIEELTKEKTVISIAHKIKTVENADQIIVLDQGRIVQKGTHQELIKEDGLYKRFIKLREEASSFKLEK